MNDEIKAAAEYVETAFIVGDESYLTDAHEIRTRFKFIREARKIARHVLAQAGREDDGEPVTFEWLQSTFNGIRQSYSKRFGYDIAEAPFGRFLRWLPAMGDSPHVLCLDEWVMIREPTRGDVRNLCAALGIPLKESTE